MSPARTVLVVAGLLCGATMQAQWQLPPGTSSSVDDGATHSTSSVGADLANAEKLMLAGDWKGAVAVLKPLTARSPKDAHALYDLGFSDEAQGDDDAARQAYEQANAADATAVPSRVALGLLLARKSDAESAAKLLREAVVLPGAADNAEARAHAYRALARIDLRGAPDRSRDELLAALKLSSETPEDILLSAEIAESLHDDAAAEQAYARALQAKPEDAEVEVLYARTLARRGKVAEASALLDTAAKQHPEDTGILAERAGLLVKQKKFAEALPLLEQMQTKEPANAALTRLLARTYVAVGTPSRSDSLFEALHKGDPENGGIAAEWADSLIRQKRNQEAEALLEKALNGRFSTKEARSDAAAELAFAASTDHHPEMVIRAISIRNENLPMDAPSAFLLATAHDTLHHTSQSAGYYRQFLELANKRYPDEEWQAQQRLLVLSRAK